MAAVAAGVQALLAQSLLIREELLLYGGNEIALGAFLGLWLLGIVAGALATRRFETRAARLVVPLLLVQGALPLVAVVLARTARDLSGIPAYEPFPLTLLLLWSVPVAVPVSLTTGALVPALAARAREVGGSVTGIYIAEAFGSLLGGAGATAALFAGVDPATLVLGCMAVGIAGSAGLIGRQRRLAAIAATVVVLTAAVYLGPRLGHVLRTRHLRTVLPGAALLDYSETPAASLMLARLNRQSIILVDGRIVAAFPDAPRVERAAGVMAAFTGAPRRLLVIGGEAVDIVPGLLELEALEEIVWLVADPGLRDFALRHVPALATDERLEVMVGDPIRHAGKLAEHGPFDAIWLMVDTPLRRSDDRFLARETLETIAGLLAEDGFLAVPVRSAENYVGPRLRLAVGTVVKGLAETLARVRLVPGDDGLLLARRSDLPIDLDSAKLAANYLHMSPSSRRLQREGFASLLEEDRVAQADSLVASLLADERVSPSDLDRPLALFNNLLVRAEQESGDLARLLEALRWTGGALWVPLLVLAIFALGNVLVRRDESDTKGAAALTLLAAGGAIGMGLDLLLLHLYQGRFGTLYLEVGWLFGLWMGGLAVGGFLGRRACQTSKPTLVGLLALAILAAVAAVIATAGSAALPSRAAGAAAFAIAGILSGALVPVAEALLAAAGILGARAGRGIEAADHLGGAACALTLGVLGIPILGLAHAAWIVTGLAGFGAGALLLAEVRERRLLGERVELRLRRAAAYESFPFRRTIAVLVSVTAAAVAGHLMVTRVLLGPRIHLEAQQLADAGLSPPWHELADPVVHYRAENTETGPVGLASRAAAPRVQGYGGPIKLLIASDGEGRITHVSFLEHRETPSYVETADEFFAALEGKSLLRPFTVRAPTPGIGVRTPGPSERAPDASTQTPDVSAQDAAAATGEAQTIDAITGATVTSRAITEALEASGRHLAEPVFASPYAGAERGKDLSDPRYLYLLGSLLLVLPVFFYGGLWLRRAWLLFHAAVGGLWLGVQFSTVQVLAWLRVEPDLDVLAFTGLLALPVLLSALVGPIYCGYLCPAGAIQELLGHAGLAQRLPAHIDRNARFIKYVVLSVLVCATLGLGSDTVLGADLLREVWATRRTGLGVLLLAVVVAGSLVTVRFGCRYLCPAGAFLNLLNKVAPLRRFLPEKNYSACDLGVRGVPDVDCLHCNRCLVGEHAAAAPAWRVAAFKVTMAVALLLLVLTALPLGRSAEHAPSVEPDIRPVDTELIKMKTRSGRLSDKRAEYWHVVRP